jgi:hypothetical protein
VKLKTGLWTRFQKGPLIFIQNKRLLGAKHVKKQSTDSFELYEWRLSFDTVSTIV